MEDREFLWQSYDEDEIDQLKHDEAESKQIDFSIIPRSLAIDETECTFDYVNSIKDNKLLSKTKIKSLVSKIKKGDLEARRVLAESYLRLVVIYAIEWSKKACRTTIPLDDFIQAGNAAVLDAIDEYLEWLKFKKNSQD